jgi:voltage-gated potassium channel
MRKPGLVERQVSRELRRPPTIRNAGSVIVLVTLATVVAGGALMRVFDSKEFETLGDAMWWSLQTVTTVGYGDIVPHNTIGRIIGAVVMLEGIAFITIVTAGITSTFIERARRERGRHELTSAEQFREAIASVDERLQRIEERLSRL